MYKRRNEQKKNRKGKKVYEVAQGGESTEDSEENEDFFVNSIVKCKDSSTEHSLVSSVKKSSNKYEVLDSKS